jgi:hypothetical protein
MSAVGILQMPLDHTRSLVVNILERFVWKIDEENIVQIPLRLIKAREA